MKRIIVLPLLVLTLSGGLTLYHLHGDAQAKPIESISPTRPAKVAAALSSNQAYHRVFPGTVEANQQSTLAFRVAGQLTQLPINAAKQVKKGDLLAGLDDTDFRNALAQRQANFDLTKTQLDKISQLIKQGYTTQSQLDEATAHFQSAEAALKQARDNLRYSRLVAPFDGIVGRVEVDNHEYVQARQAILQLQTEGQIDVRFSLPESIFSQIKGMDLANSCVQIRFGSAGLQRGQACYKEHEPMPDPTTRTYPFVVSMPTPANFTLLPGMSVDVEVDLSALNSNPSSPTVLIPVESVFERESQTWVWAIDSDQRVHQTAVTIGAMTQHYLQVLEGLKAGDQVIAAGVSHLREGQTIRPLITERGL